MSKLVKVFLMISGVMTGAGLVLCIVGFSMGARFSDLRANGDRVWFFRETRYFDSDDDSASDYNSWNAEFAEVKSLKMDIGVMEVKMEEYDGNQIRVEAEDMLKETTCKMNGDTLEVSEDGWSNRSSGDYNPEMTIYVPKNTTFEKVSLNVGVGSLEASDFSAKEVSIESGVGEVSIEGKILGNLDITCGVGSVGLDLEGRQRDFNYEISSGGVGTVMIDDEDFDDITNQKIDNGADKRMKLDCGVGELEINFES